MQKNRLKILFVSLGCDKNLVDTEFMLGLVEKAGYEFTDDEYDADIIVVNTCAFINDAKEESINTLIELGALKETGKLKALIAAGCLAQRYEREIRIELPEVDAVLGTNSWDHIVNAIEETLINGGYTRLDEIKEFDYSVGRLPTKGTHFSYLKIAEGCDKRCTYCIIPSLRGRYRSVPREELVRQARELAAMGIVELILVAQETTLYGVDLYGKKSLHLLLRDLSEIDGIEWIRLMYCYPEEIYPELVDEMAGNEHVLHYIDMPIQHVNDDILRAMGRKTTKEKLGDTLKMLKKAMPDIAVRTSLICGFPGETNEQHEELMSFLKYHKLDRVGAFTYSEEEGTKAALLPGQIDESVKETRRDEVMELVSEIIFDKNRTLIGRELDVIVDGYETNENVYVCRTYMDAPEVDGYLFLETDRTFNTGDFLRVRVTDAYEYDLIGEPL